MHTKNATLHKLIKTVLLLVLMVALLTYASYAWIRREWTPSIEQEGIKIATTGSLVFQLGEGTGYTDSYTIDEILGIQNGTFSLKPVSNCTGKGEDFFTLNQTGADGDQTYQHLGLNQYKSYSEMGIANGYLDFSFILYAPDSADEISYVYLSEAYIKDAGGETTEFARCVRVSITVDSETKIFAIDGLTGKKGVNNQTKADGTYYLEGARYYETDKATPAETVLYNGGKSEPAISVLKDQELHSFSEVNGGDPENRDPDKTLIALTNKKSVQVRVCIWVEGADENCTEAISEKSIDIALKFAAFSVQNTPATPEG